VDCGASCERGRVGKQWTTDMSDRISACRVLEVGGQRERGEVESA